LGKRGVENIYRYVFHLPHPFPNLGDALSMGGVSELTAQTLTALVF